MALGVVSGEFGVVTDPEVRFSDSGKAWAKFRGVTKERVRDSAGNWTDGKATFLDVLCFGKEAENLTESVLKGDSVIVIGRLQQNEWTDDEGTKRVTYQVVADLIGPSLKWTPAKTQRVLEHGVVDVSAIADSLGAEVVETAPF